MVPGKISDLEEDYRLLKGPSRFSKFKNISSSDGFQRKGCWFPKEPQVSKWSWVSIETKVYKNERININIVIFSCASISGTVIENESPAISIKNFSCHVFTKRKIEHLNVLNQPARRCVQVYICGRHESDKLAHFVSRCTVQAFDGPLAGIWVTAHDCDSNVSRVLMKRPTLMWKLFCSVSRCKPSRWRRLLTFTPHQVMVRYFTAIALLFFFFLIFFQMTAPLDLPRSSTASSAPNKFPSAPIMQCNPTSCWEGEYGTAFLLLTSSYAMLRLYSVVQRSEMSPGTPPWRFPTGVIGRSSLTLSSSSFSAA